MILPFTLSILECGVQCLAIGLLGPFSLKTPLIQGAPLIESMNSSDTLLKRKLPKHGSNMTVCHTAWATMLGLSIVHNGNILKKVQPPHLSDLSS
jgi:hypothetical protein